MTVILAVLKYLGIVVTTCLGAFGLLINFRDKETEQVTRGGRKLLVGIIAAGLIAVATQAVQDIRETTDREDAIEQAARGQYPLREARLTCWARIPSNDPRLLEFRQRLAANAASARAELVRGVPHVAGIGGWGGVVGGPVTHITVPPESPFYPDPNKEPFAHAVFQNVEVVLRFYRVPIPASVYPVHGSLRTRGGKEPVRPDLEMVFRRDRHLEIDYTFNDGSVGFAAMMNSRVGGGSGKIVSIANLRGAQMFIDFTPLPLYSGVSRTESRISPTLRTLVVGLGDFDPFWIDIAHTRPHTAYDGSIFYEYRFPDTIDRILELNRAH